MPEANFSIDSARSMAENARALEELLTRYSAESDSSRMKGSLLEQLTKAFLERDNVYRERFAKVFYWNEWPGRDDRKDHGIDLVAIPSVSMPENGEVTKDTPAVAIQCKFYAEGTKIKKENIDSFLAASSKRVFVERLFIDTTEGEWSEEAEAEILDTNPPLTRIDMERLRASNVDWSTFIVDSDTPPETRPRKTPRDHQVRAITDVMEGFKTHDRGKLVMACGTGKTFTSLQIAERFAKDREENARVLFMVPSLALMSQTMLEWALECQLKFTPWSVCSDTEVGRKKKNPDDLVSYSAVDLPIPPTTDPEKLATSLTSRPLEGLQVVFATYQSIDVVHQAQELAGSQLSDFDLIICDEAHRTTGKTLAGEDKSAFVRIHDNAYIRADKRLYMTATPKIYNDSAKNMAKEKDVVLVSMDDEAIFGPVFHRLGFGAAVDQGLLTDYKVVVLAVPEDQVQPIYQDMSQLAELPLTDTAKLVGCWNALAKRKNGFTDVSYGNDTEPIRRAVAFAKDIKTSKRITNDFPQLANTFLRDLTNEDLTDNLTVHCRHVDGSMNAIKRDTELNWLKDPPKDETPGNPVCHILTNARCLSEGVDVPTMDAVLFLNPRKSRVDVIQAVGRVMRRAEGKEFGYIILPVAVPIGEDPKTALDKNERFQVVWQVLSAIRAHDDRFDNTINSIELNKEYPENILIDVVDLHPQKSQPLLEGAAGGGDEPPGDDGGAGGPDGSGVGVQGVLPLIYNAAEFKEAIFSKIVKKVGNRLYWDDWSKDIATIATNYIELIEGLLETTNIQDEFAAFVESLQATLNPNIDARQAVEMLAQHLITKPLFDAMFPDSDFTAQNPVSRAMQGILTKLGEWTMFDKEREGLAEFYETMTGKIRSIDNIAGKQEIMRTLYDRFFTKAFKGMSDRLGIVFTPTPVVDYILRSADAALREHFGKTLSDRGVSLVEPFLGTGTFVTRLLQSGLIRPDDLEFKYRNEIFANEIVLLSYYIASINIEQVFHEVRASQGFSEGYVEFPGISLTDTFQMHESDDKIDADAGIFEANLARAQRQKETPIRVVVMNPPYSAGQSSANDNNQNLKYPRLDKRIEDTYVARSTGTNKNSLYDSYFRALRWATDRIGEEGVIAFVSNSSFIDGNTADGVRLTWQEEFSDIYIYNLKGNQRTQGERSRQEGGKIFGSGSRTGVAITVLVKTKGHEGAANIHYAEVDDYLARQEKLDVLDAEKDITGTTFSQITPNEFGDWLAQRDAHYLEYQALGDKKTKGKDNTPAMFRLYSAGLQTNRDAWCYNFLRDAVANNMSRMIENYNQQVDEGNQDFDATKVSWSSSLETHFKNGRKFAFKPEELQTSIYRPFCKEAVYFDQQLNHRPYQLPQIFPTPEQSNLAFAIDQDSVKEGAGLILDKLPDLHVVGTSQIFPLYTWEPLAVKTTEGTLFDNLEEVSPEPTPESFSGRFDFDRPIASQVPKVIGGYKRRDNITDATLAAYREHYKDPKLSKEDIFFYVYALLHHGEYREKYEADLKKMLPRIPKVADFRAYALTGRELADLHVNYETLEAYPGVKPNWATGTPTDPWQKYHVEKLAWAKRPGEDGKKVNDYSRLKYNDWLTFTGIPERANDYKVGGRSPLEWMVDRYRITTDKASGIVNDPNDYCREVGDAAYIAALVPRLVTVSMRILDLVAALPELAIEDEG
ncbi:MAG: DEAD/DEAH box helicase family protein [Mobiluncus sp.]|uniref:DEAD/DEAH box helicase n=1 Tax=Mobiluncus sp. TaxID=47293 RepID=UPI00259005C6|nr:type ISP restriction/modification enzyme [Mobiluncus sp.]MCI6584352.1 DEAD/DEAH box helicase family protein [Mobiluncus sp.]